MYRKIAGFAKDTLVYGIGSFAGTAVSVLLLPVYGRYLTQAEYGAYSILRVVMVVLGIIFECGVGTSLVRFYFDDRSDKDQKRLFGSGWIFTQVVSASIAIPLLVFAGPVCRLLIGPSGKPIYMQLVALQAFFSTGTMMPQVLFKVRRQAGRFSMFSFANVALMVAATAYLVVWRRMGLVGALGGMVATGAVFYAVSVPIALANVRVTIWWSKLRELLAFSLPLMPHSLSMWVLNFADRLILGKMRPLSEVGIYSFAYNIGMVMSLLVMAVQKSWPQFVYSSHVSMEESDARQLFARTAGYYWIVLCSAGLVVSAFAPEVLTLVARPGYASAASIVPLIVSAYILLGLYQVVAVGIGIMKQSKYFFLATGTGAAVNVASNLLLIPKYGIFAAAFSTILAYAVMCGIIYVLSQRLYHVAYDYKKSALTLALAGLAFAVSTLIRGELWQTIGLKVVVVAVYLGSLVLLGVVKREEIGKVRDLFSRRVAEA